MASTAVSRSTWLPSGSIGRKVPWTTTLVHSGDSRISSTSKATQCECASISSLGPTDVRP